MNDLHGLKKHGDYWYNNKVMSGQSIKSILDYCELVSILNNLT